MGEFRWPILDSGGSPERALHAFFDKLDLGQDKHCVLVTDEVLANIEPMLSLEAKVIEMPAVSQIASDAGLKKKLWARLQQIHD
jgi:DNA polymerase III psi subunit